MAVEPDALLAVGVDYSQALRDLANLRQQLQAGNFEVRLTLPPSVAADVKRIADDGKAAIEGAGKTAVEVGNAVRNVVEKTGKAIGDMAAAQTNATRSVTESTNQARESLAQYARLLTQLDTFLASKAGRSTSPQTAEDLTRVRQVRDELARQVDVMEKIGAIQAKQATGAKLTSEELAIQASYLNSIKLAQEALDRVEADRVRDLQAQNDLRTRELQVLRAQVRALEEKRRAEAATDASKGAKITAEGKLAEKLKPIDNASQEVLARLPQGISADLATVNNGVRQILDTGSRSKELWATVETAIKRVTAAIKETERAIQDEERANQKAARSAATSDEAEINRLTKINEQWRSLATIKARLEKLGGSATTIPMQSKVESILEGGPDSPGRRLNTLEWSQYRTQVDATTRSLQANALAHENVFEKIGKTLVTVAKYTLAYRALNEALQFADRFAEMDRGLSLIAAATDKSSDRAGALKQAYELAAGAMVKFGTDQKQAIELAFELTKAIGDNAEQIQGAYLPALSLVAIKEGDVKDTVQILVGLYHLYGDTLRGATTEAEKYTMITDMLNTAVNNSVASQADLLQALKTNAAQAKEAGFSLQELLATSTLLRDTLGREGPGLDRLIQQITIGARAINKAFKLNIDFSEAPTAKDILTAVMKKIREEGKLTTDQYEELKKAFPNIQSVRAVLLLADKWPEIAERIRNIASGTGSSMHILEESSKSLGASFSSTLSTIQTGVDRVFSALTGKDPGKLEGFAEFWKRLNITLEFTFKLLEGIAGLLKDIYDLVPNFGGGKFGFNENVTDAIKKGGRIEPSSSTFPFGGFTVASPSEQKKSETGIFASVLDPLLDRLDRFRESKDTSTVLTSTVLPQQAEAFVPKMPSGWQAATQISPQDSWFRLPWFTDQNTSFRTSLSGSTALNPRQFVGGGTFEGESQLSPDIKEAADRAQQKATQKDYQANRIEELRKFDEERRLKNIIENKDLLIDERRLAVNRELGIIQGKLTEARQKYAGPMQSTETEGMAEITKLSEKQSSLLKERTQLEDESGRNAKGRLNFLKTIQAETAKAFGVTEVSVEEIAGDRLEARLQDLNEKLRRNKLGDSVKENAENYVKDIQVIFEAYGSEIVAFKAKRDADLELKAQQGAKVYEDLVGGEVIATEKALIEQGRLLDEFLARSQDAIEAGALNVSKVWQRFVQEGSQKSISALINETVRTGALEADTFDLFKVDYDHETRKFKAVFKYAEDENAARLAGQVAQEQKVADQFIDIWTKAYIDRDLIRKQVENKKEIGKEAASGINLQLIDQQIAAAARANQRMEEFRRSSLGRILDAEMAEAAASEAILQRKIAGYAAYYRDRQALAMEAANAEILGAEQAAAEAIGRIDAVNAARAATNRLMLAYYKSEVGAALEASVAQIRAQEAVQEKYLQSLNFMNTAQERFADRGKAIWAEQARAAGNMFDFFAANFNRALGQASNMWSGMERFAQDSVKNIQSALSDYLFNWMEGKTDEMKAVWQNFLGSMKRALADLGSTAILNAGKEAVGGTIEVVVDALGLGNTGLGSFLNKMFVDPTGQKQMVDDIHAMRKIMEGGTAVASNLMSLLPSDLNASPVTDFEGADLLNLITSNSGIGSVLNKVLTGDSYNPSQKQMFEDIHKMRMLMESGQSSNQGILSSLLGGGSSVPVTEFEGADLLSLVSSGVGPLGGGAGGGSVLGGIGQLLGSGTLLGTYAPILGALLGGLSSNSGTQALGGALGAITNGVQLAQAANLTQGLKTLIQSVGTGGELGNALSGFNFSGVTNLSGLASGLGVVGGILTMIGAQKKNQDLVTVGQLTTAASLGITAGVGIAGGTAAAGVSAGLGAGSLAGLGGAAIAAGPYVAAAALAAMGIHNAVNKSGDNFAQLSKGEQQGSVWASRLSPLGTGILNMTGLVPDKFSMFLDPIGSWIGGMIGKLFGGRTPAEKALAEQKEANQAIGVANQLNTGIFQSKSLEMLQTELNKYGWGDMGGTSTVAIPVSLGGAYTAQLNQSQFVDRARSLAASGGLEAGNTNVQASIAAGVNPQYLASANQMLGNNISELLKFLVDQEKMFNQAYGEYVAQIMPLVKGSETGEFHQALSEIQTVKQQQGYEAALKSIDTVEQQHAALFERINAQIKAEAGALANALSEAYQQASVSQGKMTFMESLKKDMSSAVVGALTEAFTNQAMIRSLLNPVFQILNSATDKIASVGLAGLPGNFFTTVGTQLEGAFATVEANMQPLMPLLEDLIAFGQKFTTNLTNAAQVPGVNTLETAQGNQSVAVLLSNLVDVDSAELIKALRALVPNASFDVGGPVPGPVGQAMTAVVHGGEIVLNPPQQMAVASSMTGDTMSYADSHQLIQNTMHSSMTTPSFDKGGVVPGQIGEAVRATVHGGEVILNPGQQVALVSAVMGRPVPFAESQGVIQEAMTGTWTADGFQYRLDEATQIPGQPRAFFEDGGMAETKKYEYYEDGGVVGSRIPYTGQPWPTNYNTTTPFWLQAVAGAVDAALTMNPMAPPGVGAASNLAYRWAAGSVLPKIDYAGGYEYPSPEAEAITRAVSRMLPGGVSEPPRSMPNMGVPGDLTLPPAVSELEPWPIQLPAPEIEYSYPDSYQAEAPQAPEGFPVRDVLGASDISPWPIDLSWPQGAPESSMQAPQGTTGASSQAIELRSSEGAEWPEVIKGPSTPAAYGLLPTIPSFTPAPERIPTFGERRDFAPAADAIWQPFAEAQVPFGGVTGGISNVTAEPGQSFSPTGVAYAPDRFRDPFQAAYAGPGIGYSARDALAGLSPTPNTSIFGGPGSAPPPVGLLSAAPSMLASLAAPVVIPTAQQVLDAVPRVFAGTSAPTATLLPQAPAPIQVASLAPPPSFTLPPPIPAPEPAQIQLAGSVTAGTAINPFKRYGAGGTALVDEVAVVHGGEILLNRSEQSKFLREIVGREFNRESAEMFFTSLIANPFILAKGYNTGGTVMPAYNMGGSVDSVPAWLTPEEFVVPAGIARTYNYELEHLRSNGSWPTDEGGSGNEDLIEALKNSRGDTPINVTLNVNVVGDPTAMSDPMFWKRHAALIVRAINNEKTNIRK